jgi:hypothetical protein
MSKIKLSAAQLAILLNDARERGYHDGIEDDRRGGDSYSPAAILDDNDCDDNDCDEYSEEEVCADDEDAHSRLLDDEVDPGGVWSSDSWYFSGPDVRREIREHPHADTRRCILEILDIIENAGGTVVSVSHRDNAGVYAFIWDMPSPERPVNPLGGRSPSLSAVGNLTFCLKRVKYLINAAQAPMNPLGLYTYVKKDGVRYRFTHNHDGTILKRDIEIAPYVYSETRMYDEDR